MSRGGTSCHRSAHPIAPPDRTTLLVTGAMCGSRGISQVRDAALRGALRLCCVCSGNCALASCVGIGIGDMNALPVNYSALPLCCFVPPANLTACCATTSIHPSACSYQAQCKTPNDTFPLLFTPEEQLLVRDITHFWASFAANDVAQPSGGREAWPAYMYRDDASAAKSNTMQLDVELEVRDTGGAVSFSPRVLPHQCTVHATSLPDSTGRDLWHRSDVLHHCRCGLGIARIQGRRLSVLGARATAKT